MSFHNVSHVKKTRRARTCDWCWERIETGAPSIVTSGIFEGDFYRGRYHPECNEAAGRYYEKHRCWNEAMPEDRMNRGGIEEYNQHYNLSLL
jgi:hypothetical protein